MSSKTRIHAKTTIAPVHEGRTRWKPLGNFDASPRAAPAFTGWTMPSRPGNFTPSCRNRTNRRVELLLRDTGSGTNFVPCQPSRTTREHLEATKSALAWICSTMAPTLPALASPLLGSIGTNRGFRLPPPVRKRKPSHFLDVIPAFLIPASASKSFRRVVASPGVASQFPCLQRSRRWSVPRASTTATDRATHGCRSSGLGDAENPFVTVCRPWTSVDRKVFPEWPGPKNTVRDATRRNRLQSARKSDTFTVVGLQNGVPSLELSKAWFRHTMRPRCSGL